MLYLSRLILNMRHRGVQYDLADCQRLHGRILGAFSAAPDQRAARDHFGVLYRAESLDNLPLVRLLVQSNQLPDWTSLPPGYLGAAPDARGNPAVRPLDDYNQLATGMHLRFRLRANPTKRISERNVAQEAQWRGKRIELRREEDQLAWLERKGGDGGFSLLQVQLASDQQLADVRISPGPKQRGKRPLNGTRMSFGVVIFEGLLAVTDAERFAATLQHGVGSGKAYGFGLLSVAVVQQGVST